MAQNMEINYKFACRCCLKSEAEFFKLDSLTESGIGDNDATSKKIPLIRLLLFCMRTENIPELPQYICAECSKSLQIAYFFIQNCLRAHEILCRKLCPGKLPKKQLNGQYIQLTELSDRQDSKINMQATGTRRSAVRHECKVCGAIIYDRMKLRAHIRMHTEASRHKCKLCNFMTLKHRQLPEHYRRAHGLTATQIEHQLKMRKSMQAAAAANAAALNAVNDDSQVKVCTLEDMELLIPTVLTPEDFSHPQLDAEQLRAIEKQLSNPLPSHNIVSSEDSQSVQEPESTTAGANNNMTIGAEFLVLPDGTLQQVNDGGVVFEYIDDSKGTTTTTTNMSLHSLFADTDSSSTLNYADTDIPMNTTPVENTLPQITVKPKIRPPPPTLSSALKHKCNLCPKAFPTVARLKSHQLTHSHLPKFYCDQCDYYSLRSSDLIQHYTAEHKSIVDGSKVNQPLMDKNRIFSCDMCLFEATSSGQLRAHYSNKHMMQPSEVQLRPNWANEIMEKGNSSQTSDDGKLQCKLGPPSIPLGIKYPAPIQTAVPISQPVQPESTTTAVLTANGEINVVVDATPLFYAAGVPQISRNEAVITSVTTSEMSPETSPPITSNSNTFALYTEQSFDNNLPTTVEEESSGMLATASPAVPTENANNSIFGDMQEFIDNTDVAAICTIPADDMPVVDGDDIVIDNNNMSLDFDTELFEDFEEDVVGEEDEEEDVENDDENDNNDAAADQNLLLTSDDDDVDDFDDEQSEHLQKPYCVYCNKKFISQYKFENHMFIHRGLAPYRCELCTNLYNKKRLLIRHYKTVHKRMPTRDMVQAKGDKVSVPRTAIEKLNINADKPPILMCAKCPFECDQDGEIRKHLNAHHGINEGVSAHANEVFIIRKLPFECPRCIRSFAAKRTLTRHLQKSHLVDTIIEMQAPQLTTSSAATTTTSTSTTTLPKNASGIDDNDSNKTTPQHESNMMSYDDGDSNGKCDKNVQEEMENSDSHTDRMKEVQVLTAATTETISGSTDVTDDINQTKTSSSTTTAETTTTASASIISTDAAEVAAATATSMTPISCPLTTVSTTKTTVSACSTLYPTPTPFDFDLDFIGNNNNNSFITPSSSHLVNGSDKLLTAALDPSLSKDLRLPRTPIFVCKQCNQTFDELNKMLQHEVDQHSNRTVSSYSPYQHQCSICNTTYRTATLLNYHMKRHASRKIDCKQCSKQFTYSSDLEEHIQSEHTVRTQLKCGVDGCKKLFNYKHHLKRHQTASHMPVKYICPECGRDMLTSLHLRNHMASHRGTHSYRCPKCVRTYLRRNPFRRHAIREHKWEVTDDEINKLYCLNETYNPTNRPKTHVKKMKLKSEKLDNTDDGSS